MKFQSFKSFAKYGLVFIFMISLVCTAYADPDQTVNQNGSTDNEKNKFDNPGYENNSANNSSTTFMNSSVNHTVRGPGHGGIALSWDDTGHTQTCHQNLELFKKYNATCTMNVNRIETFQSIPPATLKKYLKDLHDAGWEISTHGYHHENSRLFLINHTPEEWLNLEIFPNIAELTSYGYPVYTLAYPNSDRTTTSDSIVSPFFRTLRTGAPQIVNRNVNETDLAYYDWTDKKLLYGVEIDDRTNVSLQSIEYGIDRAIEDETVLVLYGHTITSDVTDRYQTSTAKLEAILNYTKSKGGKFYLMGDLGDSNWEPPANLIRAKANFSISRDRIEAGKNVTFEDHSINQTSEVILDFGDGSPTSSTANISHKYTTPGNYTANLTASNLYSSDSTSQTIMVYQSIPVADFTSNITNGPCPLSVEFTDISTGGFLTAWEWDFGDGTTSNEQNPVHEYLKAGSYTVNLTVNNNISSDSTQKANYITVLPGAPSANFQLSRTSGYAPLTIQFTDTSTGDPTSWNWNFGDGTANSIEKNPAHTYSSAGDYCVNLTASNAIGNSSKAATINVYSSGGGGSSKSGGGSGGGSPEPATNVQVKELSQTQITNGKPVKFDFTRNVSCIMSVTFDAKKTVGKTTGTVEMLKGKSTLVSPLSSGEVYKFFNLWIGNAGFATASNIANPVINFKVEKAWIKDKNIDSSSITLNRYSDKKWEQIPASLTGEDSNYLYFSAKTPGFSFFGITGKAKETEIKPEPDSQETPKNISSEVPQKTATEQKTETSANKPLPGFEMASFISYLLCALLCRRK